MSALLPQEQQWWNPEAGTSWHVCFSTWTSEERHCQVSYLSRASAEGDERKCNDAVLPVNYASCLSHSDLLRQGHTMEQDVGRGHGVTRETLDWLKTREKGTQQIGIVLAGKVRRELTLPSLGSAHKTHLEKKWGRGKRETGRKGSVIWATLEMKS